MEENVILVDDNDEIVGVGEKLETHLKGNLHRAFSIFIFNQHGEVLLQKRASTKYHSGNLWSNTCCGHPRPSETTREAANRRLKEEMGINCELKEAFSFIYRVELDKGLFEHEYDYVFVGNFNGTPLPDPSEVSDWVWVDLDTLKKSIDANPSDYTYWLLISIDRIASLLDH